MKLLTLTFSLACLVFAAACGANDSILKSGKEPASQGNSVAEKTPFAKDLESVQTAGFSFIYVLRRKDGAKIDSEDKSVIKLQTAQANRRISADDGLAVIVGTNFPLTPENMAALYKRFAIENYSPAPAVNAGSNSNK